MPSTIDTLCRFLVSLKSVDVKDLASLGENRIVYDPHHGRDGRVPLAFLERTTRRMDWTYILRLDYQK